MKSRWGISPSTGWGKYLSNNIIPTWGVHISKDKPAEDDMIDSERKLNYVQETVENVASNITSDNTKSSLQSLYHHELLGKVKPIWIS